MRKFLCLLALGTLSLTSDPEAAYAAEEYGKCGDNLRECIRDANIEWRRTHDDNELEQSHNMCNTEFAICVILSLF
ncbi:MAG: hypothetical protein HKN17_11230 [Rhodothermales bacterium]|nr:hypothetical protein [Rhodothermales bacterium]